MGNLKPIKELFDFEKGQLQSSKNTEGDYTFITAAEEWKTHESFTHDCEALVFAAAASGSLGRTHYYKGEFIASDLCFVLTPKERYKDLIDLKFYHTIFNDLKEDIVKKTSTGTSKVSINRTNFGAYEIPFFDKEHQETVRKKLENVHPIKTKLSNELQTQSKLINKLRSSILSDAVSGKLVPQDPNDESAKVLLEKIKTEKEKLIKEGKIKKQKPLPPISEDEIPYELPNGWVWCRLSNVCKNIHYGYTASAEQSYDEPKMLRITDIQNNSVNWERVPHCKISDEEMDKYLLKERDILVARTGGTVGKSFLMTNVPVKSVFASYLIRLIPSDFINEQYLKLILESPLYWKQIIAKSMGTGQPNVNGTSLGELVMSFPPLEEQKRIVEKVEKLMATCDELELEVQNSKIETEKLMQSVLKEAFEK
jgi:type I restriction enzyme S subunit